MAFTIKDMKGTTGTNTMYEKIEVPQKDTVVEVFHPEDGIFRAWKLSHFPWLHRLYMEGDFHVFHCLYDACSVNVVSMKDTVGFFYDMNSRIEVQVTKNKKGKFL